MKFVGGRMCLEFVNTVDAWTGGAGPADEHPYGDIALREKLVDYDSLVRWGRLASVLSAREASHLVKRAKSHSAEATAILNRALRLRRSIYRLMKSVLENWHPTPADVERLHGELALARTHERLVYCRGGFRWGWEELPDALDQMLWPVSRSAAELLTSSELSKLRQCGGEECGWMFLDASRNRSRLWCDMTDCGNLNKVRRFRNKHSAASGR